MFLHQRPFREHGLVYVFVSLLAEMKPHVQADLL